MKLQNGDRAIADRRKLEEYCLNPHHPRGRNKARVVASVGIRQADSDVLRDALLVAARDAEAVPGPQAGMASDAPSILIWSVQNKPREFGARGSCESAKTCPG